MNKEYVTTQYLNFVHFSAGLKESPETESSTSDS